MRFKLFKTLAYILKPYSRSILLWLNLIIVPFAFSSDLSIQVNYLFLAGEKNAKGYSYELASKIDTTVYEYRGNLVLNNAGNKKISVITGKLDITLQKKTIPKIDKLFTVKIYHQRNTFEERLVVPSLSELKIVTLMRNESAFYPFSFRSRKKLTKVNFKYQITDHYNGRFQYWTGEISTGNVIVKKLVK